MDISLLHKHWEISFTAWKVSKCGVFSGPYFPVFRLNTKIYEVNLHIQSEYRKLKTRKNIVFGHFSRSVCQINKSSDLLLRLASDYKKGKTYRYYKCEFVKETLHTMFGQLLRKMARDLEGKSILHTVHVQPGFWDVVIMWQPCYLE